MYGEQSFHVARLGRVRRPERIQPGRPCCGGAERRVLPVTRQFAAGEAVEVVVERGKQGACRVGVAAVGGGDEGCVSSFHGAGVRPHTIGVLWGLGAGLDPCRWGRGRGAARTCVRPRWWNEPYEAAAGLHLTHQGDTLRVGPEDDVVAPVMALAAASH